MLVVAHTKLTPHQHRIGREANVVDLVPWDTASYEAPWLTLQPSMIWVGDSHLFWVALPEPNHVRMDFPMNATVVGAMAERLDARYPAPAPRTYLRFAGPGWSGHEGLSLLSLWLERGHSKPVPVVVEVDLTDPSPARVLRAETRDVMEHFPESAQALLPSLERLPDSGPLLEALRRPKAPLSFDTIERRLNTWCLNHGLYYGDALSTTLAPSLRYQQLEAPVLRSIFGRSLQETLEPHPPRRPDFRQVRTFLAYFKERGIPTVCYAPPLNPNVVPMTDDLRMRMAGLRKVAAEGGCTYIDTTGAVSADLENWGYAKSGPDPDHLSAIGARRFADFLVREGAKVGAWSTLEHEAGATAP